MPSATKVDGEDDTKVDEDDDPLVKGTSELRPLRGEEPKRLERKARFYVGCDGEHSQNSLMCAFCGTAPTGARSSVGADAVEKLIQVLAPINKKWVDSSVRSLAATTATGE